VLVALAATLAPNEAAAIEPIRDRWEYLDPRAPNQVAIEAMTLGDHAGVDFAYRRGLGRHLSIGALFEYAYPNPGYGHLVGFGHTLELAGWIKRPWTGLFLTLSVTVGHQFVFGLPQLRSVALGGGASLGWSWDLTAHVNVALSGGLRRMGVVDRSTQICTVPNQCVFTQQGFKPHFALTFAYRF
jgi:hypothetical protein